MDPIDVQKETLINQLLGITEDDDDGALTQICTQAADWIRCGGKPVSYTAQIIAHNDGLWIWNALRFATRKEAEHSIAEIAAEWKTVQGVRIVTATRVIGTNDPVNYRWDKEAHLIKLP